MENEDFKIDLMVQKGLITEDQAHTARQKAEANDTTVMEAILSSKYTTEQDVVKMLAEEYGLGTYDFEKTEKKVDPDIIDLLPGEVAKKYRMIPVKSQDNVLYIAMSDPGDFESLDAVRYLLKRDVEAVVASERQIKNALSFYYGKAESGMDEMLQELDPNGGVELVEQEDPNKQKTDNDDDAPVIRLVSLIILEAFRSRASDIHMEPLEKRFRVRYRIDGVLNEVESPPKFMQNSIISRLKLMAGLDISEHRIPQDGRIQFAAMGRKLDLRVSDLPTTNGESIVMRILDKSGVMLGISELGFFSSDQDLINSIIHYPDGIFLVTGPTGSGKTTSLYSFLHALNQPTVKIITAEDPVEYEMSGINQVQIVSDIGMTFVAALRSMLRQAPNIIMVGEIRDNETGEIAVNAALTGHLVFSTLHTNDAPSTITRLIDMGLKPFLVASALRAVLAQRLVRRLCKTCSEAYELSEPEMQALDVTPGEIKDLHFRKPKGCSECKKGYRGRMGIYEILILDEVIQDLVYQQVDAGVIRRKAMERGMRTLRMDGIQKAGAGMTSVAEVLRLTVNS